MRRWSDAGTLQYTYRTLLYSIRVGTCCPLEHFRMKLLGLHTSRRDHACQSLRDPVERRHGHDRLHLVVDARRVAAIHTHQVPQRLLPRELEESRVVLLAVSDERHAEGAAVVGDYRETVDKDGNRREGKRAHAAPL